MHRTPRVALLIETSNAYGRELLHGIRAYLREHRPWSISLVEAGRGARPPQWLQGWRGDGVIARIETPAIARAVAATRLPAVDLSAARLLPALPWLETDDRAIGRLAAQHLRERGFSHLAYCGEARFNWSRWREAAFTEAATAAGLVPHVFRESNPDAAPDWNAGLAAIERWLRRLPRPVGIFTGYDIRGVQVLEACRRLGLAVPDEAAVLGVDNDELLCDLADPPLSSVQPDTRRTGYEAAALLERLMAGERIGPDGRLFPPLGVVTRRSTDVVAVDDPAVSAAVRFIREHACDGIGVGEVLRHVPVSRRVLEGRFRRLLGCSPHDQIQRVKLDRVKRMLLETDLPLSVIAERAGFAHVEYLSVAFKKQVGVPPSEYRAGRRDATTPQR